MDGQKQNKLKIMVLSGYFSSFFPGKGSSYRFTTLLPHRAHGHSGRKKHGLGNPSPLHQSSLG